MTTQLLEKVITGSDNGDKYWQRPFNARDSIEQVRLLESKKLDAQVKCGLVLWRSQFNLSHGAWIPYLLRCGMNQTTAWRRKDRAMEFLTWAGILGQMEKLTERHVHQGLELAYDKSFRMNDFREYQFQLKYDTIVSSLQEAVGGSPPRRISLRKLLGFELQKVLTGLRAVDEFQHRWTDEERLEVRDSLTILIEQCQQRIRNMKEFDAIKMSRKSCMARKRKKCRAASSPAIPRVV